MSPELSPYKNRGLRFSSTCPSLTFTSYIQTSSFPFMNMQFLVLHLVSLLPTVRIILIFINLLLFVRLLITRSSILPLSPGPLCLPLVGFLPFLGRDIHLTLTKLTRKFGPIYQVFLGNERIVLSDSSVVRESFQQQVFSGRPDTISSHNITSSTSINRTFMSTTHRISTVPDDFKEDSSAHSFM